MTVQHVVRKPAAVCQTAKGNQHPRATCVLLQGNSKVATKKLFLFPDGSGSAASYMHIGRISPDVVVYGLNCPYLKTPEEWKCGLPGLTPLYIKEIRKRQPRGPYFLGGYSTGGICAFDAARSLHQQGEQVTRLLLIDTPCPIDLKRLPHRLFEFLKTAHLFESNGREPPDWVFPHFEANTDSLQKYRVRPFESYCEPTTHILWAGKGVSEDLGSSLDLEIDDEDPKEMRWIMCKRDDFGPRDWDRLLNPNDVHIDVVEHGNHFSMMRGANARKVAAFLERAMR